MELDDDIVNKILSDLDWNDKNFEDNFEDILESESPIRDFLQGGQNLFNDFQNKMISAKEINENLSNILSKNKDAYISGSSGDATLTLSIENLRKWEEDMNINLNQNDSQDLERIMAKDLIQSYYCAMNNRSVDDSISFLSNDIEVEFIDDPSKNWKGLDLARSKFTGMFERMPNFVGTINKINTEEHDLSLKLYSVKADCRFACPTSESDSTRTMNYIVNVKDLKIIKIVHE